MGVVDCKVGVVEELFVVLNKDDFLFILKVEEDLNVGVGDVKVVVEEVLLFLNILELVVGDVWVVGFVDGDVVDLLKLNMFDFLFEMRVVFEEFFVLKLVV